MGNGNIFTEKQQEEIAQSYTTTAKLKSFILDLEKAKEKKEIICNNSEAEILLSEITKHFYEELSKAQEVLNRYTPIMDAYRLEVNAVTDDLAFDNETMKKLQEIDEKYRKMCEEMEVKKPKQKGLADELI